MPTLDCPRCRTRIPAQAAFCPHCGADVTGLTRPPALPHSPTRGISGRRIVVLLLLLIVVIFGSLSILIMALHRPAVLPPAPRNFNRPMFSR